MTQNTGSYFPAHSASASASASAFAVADPQTDNHNYNSNNNYNNSNMTRSPSADSAKASNNGGKRKGARSVSTLTPQQLARKRANDREAQRAIRARTKDHIEYLEQQLAEVKERNSDETMLELRRRNRELEEEIARLHEKLNRPSSLNSSPYSSSTPVYEDSISPGSGPISTPTSPFPAGAEYNPMPQFVPMPDGEPWAASPPSPATDDYGIAATYIPTSVPASMVPVPQPQQQQHRGHSHNNQLVSTLGGGHKDAADYGEIIDINDVAFAYGGMMPSDAHMQSLDFATEHQNQQQSWNSYSMYCQQQPSVH